MVNEEELTKIIKSVAKTVKIQLQDESMDKFINTVKSVLQLSQLIDDCPVREHDATIFFNFPFQKLQLLEKPVQTENITFFRKTIDNMIYLPKSLEQ